MDSVPIERMEFPVAGGKLVAYRLGPAGAPTVLAVHGITGNAYAWLPTARALGERATMLAVDLRGRADSNALPGPYGTAAYVADLVAVLETLDQQPALTVGHSLGAYIISRLGVEHRDSTPQLLLVDGGLAIPGSEVAEPQEFVRAFLGPALARLSMRFPSAAAYHDWWRAHPAFAGHDVADEDLIAYADHDLRGEEPELHSSVLEAAIRDDAAELAEVGSWAQRLDVPATLLCAPRGLLDDPSPMQPLAQAQAWAAAAPDRRAQLVEDVNHYTITLGARGASAVADAIAELLAV